MNASSSKTMVALMNIRWAESKECRYEFNIATRSLLTKGFPQIIPVILEQFDFNKYPLITGVMANTNAIFYNSKDPTETWNKVLAAVQTSVQPYVPGGSAVISVPTATTLPEQLPEKISEWTIKHVSQWVQSLNLPGSPKDAFEINWVDGQTLLELTIQDMQESLKFTNLQAKRMLREITEYKNRPPTTPLPAATTRTKAQKLSGAMLRMGGSVTSAMVGAVPAKLNILKSKSGFLTGVWEGWYDYDSNNTRDKVFMDVTMIGSIISGYGTDQVGDFLVQGSYDDEQLTCCWDKAYIGAHTVYYTGKLEGGKTIKGKWNIPGSVSGKFEMTYKPKK
jgi:hypothetical protein